MSRKYRMLCHLWRSIYFTHTLYNKDIFLGIASLAFWKDESKRREARRMSSLLGFVDRSSRVARFHRIDAMYSLVCISIDNAYFQARTCRKRFRTRDYWIGFRWFHWRARARGFSPSTCQFLRDRRRLACFLVLADLRTNYRKCTFESREENHTLPVVFTRENLSSREPSIMVDDGLSVRFEHVEENKIRGSWRRWKCSFYSLVVRSSIFCDCKTIDEHFIDSPWVFMEPVISFLLFIFSFDFT